MSVSLADVMRRHGPAYRERHGGTMLPSHAKAMSDIVSCRTPQLGAQVSDCPDCGRQHLLYHSCGHRACPRCGSESTARWMERQRELLLPVPYFHVVFTLPSELRRLVRSHQRALLPVLFQAAFESLARLCKDARYLGAEQIGALAVLHTWTRTLEWHPHVHLLVPGGGLAADGRTWKSPPRRRTRYLVPERALADAFRGRFLALARKALPDAVFPQIPWKKRWIVHAKPAVQGADTVLGYLGRYVHRTALTDKALVACDDRSVTFTYRRSGETFRRAMTLPPDELLRRFLQHVLPKGLHRVRSFGLLHRAHRSKLRQLQLALASRASSPAAAAPRRVRPVRRCPHCGHSPVRPIRRLSPDQCLAWLAAEPPSPVARAPP